MSTSSLVRPGIRARAIQGIVASGVLMFAATIVAFTVLHATRSGRADLGAGRPLLVQYAGWLFRVLRGDLGWSSGHEQLVTQEIAERLPATIELWLIALLATIVLGALFGLVRARLDSTPLGNAVVVLELLARALPVFLFGLLLQMAAMVTRLPVAGIASRDAFDFGDRISHLIVPVLLLAVPFAAWSARLFRDAFITAEARNGALRSMTALVTMTISLIGPALLSATIIVEILFAWPGIGRLFSRGFSPVDGRVMGGFILTYVAAVVAMKLVAGVMLGLSDRMTPPRTGAQRGWVTARGRGLLANWVSVLGLVICAVLGIIVLGANVFAPMNPNSIDQAHWEGYPLAPGMAGHVLGTDENGRDLLSRALFGVRSSLGIAFLAALIATVIGTAIAKATARLPWIEDRAALAVTGIRAFGFYPLVIVLAGIVFLTAGVQAITPLSIALIIAAVSWPAIVTAARGERWLSDVLATAVSAIAAALLIEVTMSFWGFGVQPPAPSLGNMLVNAQSNLAIAPWAVEVPSAIIVVCLFALNAVGDALRDLVEP